MPDLHRIRRHIERHVINHGSMVKRISYSKKNARLSSRSDIVLDSSLSLLLPRNQEKKKEKEKRKKKKNRGKRDDVLLISFFMLFRIDGDIFLQARDTSSSPLKYRDEGGGGSISWSVGKEIGARHFLLEPRARIRSVYRMQIDRLGRSGGRESGSSPSGRTTERRS